MTTAPRHNIEPADHRGSAWNRLFAELDQWSATGQTATLWWRDDDADATRPALRRLLSLRERAGVALALAVVPQSLDASLADALLGQRDVSVVQHGYSHANFAAPDDRKIELDGSRPAEYVLADLAVGFERLSSMPGWQPVLVPPWNRIAAHLVPMLPEIGFRGLSTVGPRARRQPVARLTQNNVHLDPIDWRGRVSSPGGFAGADRVLDRLTAHLYDRRTGRADTDEATGLMTHHKVQTAQTWDFVERLITETAAHPAVRWCAVADLFVQ